MVEAFFFFFAPELTLVSYLGPYHVLHFTVIPIMEWVMHSFASLGVYGTVVSMCSETPLACFNKKVLFEKAYY